MRNLVFDFSVPDELLSYDMLKEFKKAITTNISHDLINAFQIVAVDGLGGRHPLDSTNGIRPDGSICENCDCLICEFCPRLNEVQNDN